MRVDNLLIALLFAAILIAGITRPWAEREHPERAQLLTFVKRMGDAIETFNKDVGYYPRIDAPQSYVYYLLHEGPKAPYLDFTPKEIKKFLKGQDEKEDVLEARYVEILDPLGTPLHYRFPTYPRRFDLYSCGSDKYDDGGTEDDVNYLPPHFDNAYWNKDRHRAWVILGVIVAVMILRTVMLLRAETAETPEEPKEA